MKHRYYTALLLVCVLMCTLLTGCGEEEDIRKQADTVFTFSGKNVSQGEVFIYYSMMKDAYETTYGDDVWSTYVYDISSYASLTDSQSLATEQLSSVLPEDVLQNIINVKLLCMESAEYGVSVSDDELSELETAAEEFYRGLADKQISELSITEELITTVLMENVMASKTYAAVIDAAKLEVSDEDARETTFYDMYFGTVDDRLDGTVVELTDTEKEEQRKLAEEAYNMLINPVTGITSDSDTTGVTDVEELAEYLGLDKSKYYTMTPEEISSVYGEDICSMLYTLENGSYSLVTESQYGYHIFYMKALTDREATDERKAELLTEKKLSYMTSCLETWQQETDPDYAYPDSVDMTLYQEVIDSASN